jgi:Protein of unknown function (DUF3443)
MANITRVLRGSCCTAILFATISCGGGGGGRGLTAPAPVAPAPTSNVAAVMVDAGPTPTSPSVNTLFTAVTVCVPGSTTNCQTIDHIQVDTASFGLRILSSVLTLTLPVQTVAGGSLVECTEFGDGYSWGPVAAVDFTIAGETVANMPIQIIGDSRFPNVPTNCSGTATKEDTVSEFGANGIIGIGVVATDCPDCSVNANDGVYYSCSTTAASSCTSTMVPLANQVPNPVARFAVDNNGSILQLPTVALTGAATVTGSLIFGVDTQSNNQSGTQTVVFVNPNNVQLTMTYRGQPLNDSFIDSGTNGIYFTDSTLPTCTDAPVFYCPTSTQALMVSIEKQGGGTIAEPFSVVNADTLTTAITAYPGLAGTNSIGTNSFDWGLSFYYGRRVATVIAGKSTSVGNGPYIAF